MSIDIPGLVETSNNLAVAKTGDDALHISCMLRSSVDSARDDLAARIAQLVSLAGGSSEYSGAATISAKKPAGSRASAKVAAAERSLGGMAVFRMGATAADCSRFRRCGQPENAAPSKQPEKRQTGSLKTRFQGFQAACWFV